MKIAMIVGTDLSHDVRVWKEATTLARAGHAVTVLAAWNNALPAAEEKNGVSVIRVAPRERQPAATAEPTALPAGTAVPERQAPAAPKFAMIRGAAWKLRVGLESLRLLRELKPDAVHIHDSDRLFLGLMARSWLRVPIVYDAHEYVAGLIVDDSWEWKITRRLHLLLERIVIPRTEATITVNDAIGEKLRARYRVPRLVTLHNFPTWQPAASASPDLRAALPAEHRDKRILLYQGRLTAYRGIEQFLETLQHVPDVAGVIVGGGPKETDLKALAAQLGLGSRVAFIPQVPWERVAAYTAGADLGFTLSQDTCENNILALPNKLFEYLMAGVPVVASDYPVLRQYVVTEEVGIVVPPGDPREIARRVSALLDEPARLERMKRHALDVARTKYNWEAQSHRLVEIYTPTTSSFRPAPVSV